MFHIIICCFSSLSKDLKQSFLQIYFTLKISAGKHKLKEFSTRRKSFPLPPPSTKTSLRFRSFWNCKNGWWELQTSAYYTPLSVYRFCSQDRSGSQVQPQKIKSGEKNPFSCVTDFVLSLSKNWIFQNSPFCMLNEIKNVEKTTKQLISVLPLKTSTEF